MTPGSRRAFQLAAIDAASQSPLALDPGRYMDASSDHAHWIGALWISDAWLKTEHLDCQPKASLRVAWQALSSWVSLKALEAPTMHMEIWCASSQTRETRHRQRQRIGARAALRPDRLAAPETCQCAERHTAGMPH